MKITVHGRFGHLSTKISETELYRAGQFPTFDKTSFLFLVSLVYYTNFHDKSFWFDQDCNKYIVCIGLLCIMNLTPDLTFLIKQNMFWNFQNLISNFMWKLCSLDERWPNLLKRVSHFTYVVISGFTEFPVGLDKIRWFENFKKFQNRIFRISSDCRIFRIFSSFWSKFGKIR